MRHTLRLHDVVIGYSDLEDIDPGIGRASGAFRPGLGYDLVQPVFRIFARAMPRDGGQPDRAALVRYYGARDALEFQLVDAEDRRVNINSVHIADYTVEEGPTAISVDVLIKDDAYWARRTGGTGLGGAPSRIMS